MEKLTDPELCRRLTQSNPDCFSFNSDEWFSNPLNFTYVEDDNVAFGEYKSPGVYWGHLCFNSAKGRQAIELGKRVVQQLIKDSGLTTLVGVIETKNRKTCWLIRQLGFTSLGPVETEDGECEMFFYVANRR